jgi:hypothetical protein
VSYSTVWGLWPGTERRVKLAEYRNSWGLAPVVWDAMAQKYLGSKPYGYSQRIEELWPLHDDAGLPRWHRSVLRMTFDTRYIADADRPLAMDDIALWLHDFAALLDPKAVNHWPRFAWDLAAQRAEPPPAIGVHQTSVSRNPWQGPFDEDADAYLPFDWSTAASVYDDIGRDVDGGKDKPSTAVPPSKP